MCRIRFRRLYIRATVCTEERVHDRCSGVFKFLVDLDTLGGTSGFFDTVDMLGRR